MLVACSCTRHEQLTFQCDSIKALNNYVWSPRVYAYWILFSLQEGPCMHCFRQRWCHQVVTLNHNKTKGGFKGQGRHNVHETGFSVFQYRLCLPPMLLWKICLAANMLWKALISYLSRSSMHQDNKHYLILLCSLMSQLKGLVLPLAMGLAERIVCRLVNKGLWRSWRAFKMLVCSCRGSCVCAFIGILAASCFSASSGVQEYHTTVGRHHYTQWDPQ